MFKRSVIGVFVFLFLSGCSFIPAKTFSDDDLTSRDYAVIFGEKNDGWWARFSSYVDEKKVDEGKNYIGNPLFGYPDEIRATPGIYTIKLDCSSGSLSSSPSIRLNVKKQHTYVVVCDRDGLFVGAALKDVYLTQ